MAQPDHQQLSRIVDRFHQAVVDPAAWSAVLDDICGAIGASAAVMLQSDNRTPDAPRTASIEEATQLYFRHDWHLRDPRARGFSRMMAGEIITDADLFSPEQLLREPMYNELLQPFDFRWFAGVGFWAGSAFWALTIQRSESEGLFEERDKRLLAAIAPKLTEAATLATAVGRIALTATTDAIDQVRKAALVLDRQGLVLSVNAAAAAGFDDEIRVRERRLALRDTRAAAKLDRLLDAIRAEPEADLLPAEPIPVRRSGKPPAIIHALPIRGPACSAFLGARVLLVLSNLAPPPIADFRLIASTFDLTPAEGRLAALLAAGSSVDEASQKLGIARETARTQLKSAFEKMGVHRQAELVALVARLA